MNVRVSCPTSCTLVDADTWFPGWIATIDEQKTTLQEVDGALRGVVVPAGIHVVSFYFQPDVLVGGSIVSALAAASLTAYLLLGIARKARYAEWR